MKRMHFEILVEDKSGKKVLEIVVAKILGDGHTYRIIAYKGIGRVPSNLKKISDPNKRILLDQLPRLLRGYGKTHSNYRDDYSAVVLVVCDLDDKCMKSFRAELLGVLNSCNPAPNTHFCIAIEEGEAWLLGDFAAIKAAYATAKQGVLTEYVNDAICNTWEKLADAIYPGGASKLKRKGWQAVGVEKYHWAEQIAPHMDVENNLSPSFIYFRDKLRVLAAKPSS